MPHRSLRWLGILAAAAVLAVTGAAFAGARGGPPNVYTQRNLVSDIAGVARITDRHLVNPWGLAFGPTTPAWVSDNGTGLSTLYSGAVRGSIPTKVPLEVTIPDGAPTGVVFNNTTGFKLGANPARFIFASEAGTITAWNAGTTAQTVATTPNAVYKGLAIASSGGKTFLYAANFRAGTIDVFDDAFMPTKLSGDFTDSNLPTGFAPFNIQEIGGKLYVSYAEQDADKMDDVPGAGLGFVDVYDTSGHLMQRLISNGALNAPWGLTVAPKQFGAFGGDLLVGNFGDGVINAYNPSNGQFEGALRNTDGNVITIDGLWALRFGNGTIGTPRTLLFTAGIADESHGIFGSIEAGRR